MVCGVECPGCASVGGRWVLTVRCCFPVARVAIALAESWVSRGTDGVVRNDEFDVLAKVCPGPVRVVSLSVALGKD